MTIRALLPVPVTPRPFAPRLLHGSRTNTITKQPETIAKTSPDHIPLSHLSLQIIAGKRLNRNNHICNSRIASQLATWHWLKPPRTVESYHLSGLLRQGVYATQSMARFRSKVTSVEQSDLVKLIICASRSCKTRANLAFELLIGRLHIVCPPSMNQVSITLQHVMFPRGFHSGLALSD